MKNTPLKFEINECIRVPQEGKRRLGTIPERLEMDLTLVTALTAGLTWVIFENYRCMVYPSLYLMMACLLVSLLFAAEACYKAYSAYGRLQDFLFDLATPIAIILYVCLMFGGTKHEKIHLAATKLCFLAPFVCAARTLVAMYFAADDLRSFLSLDALAIMLSCLALAATSPASTNMRMTELRIGVLLIPFIARRLCTLLTTKSAAFFNVADLGLVIITCCLVTYMMAAIYCGWIQRCNLKIGIYLFLPLDALEQLFVIIIAILMIVFLVSPKDSEKNKAPTSSTFSVVLSVTLLCFALYAVRAIDNRQPVVPNIILQPVAPNILEDVAAAG